MKDHSTAFLDHFVFTKKTPFMQRVSDLVRNGHHHYVSGMTSLDKAGFLAAKFDERFHIGRNKVDACRARRHGQSSSRLLLLDMGKTEPSRILWILLHQPGEKLTDTERWQDALTFRINITGYELVRLTKPTEPKPVWTWRYCRSRHDALRDAVILAIRHRRDDELRQLIHSVWRSPGFGGVRDQVKKFKALIAAEWRRSRSKGSSLPEIPDRIGYVRRIPDCGARLSHLRNEEKSQTRSVRTSDTVLSP